MPRRDEEEDIGSGPDNDGGLVGRLFKRGVGAPTAALGYLGEQFNGWKSEFMVIFQTEMRRFLDRVNPSEELDKLIAGKRLEITASIRLVPDDRPKAKAKSEDSGEKKPKKAKKPR
jgi:hypothetical protein